MGLKIPRFTITGTANDAPAFYELLGPFLSRREVVAELGAPVWDDDGKQWYVATPDEPVDDLPLLGFVAVHGGSVCSFYVIPDARGEAVGSALMFHVLNRHPAVPLKAVATPAAVGLFKMFGFREVSARGRYMNLERSIDARVE